MVAANPRRRETLVNDFEWKLPSSAAGVNKVLVLDEVIVSLSNQFINGARMRDRTKELRNSVQGSDDDDENTALMINAGTGVPPIKDDKENEVFFRKVQDIREGLETLKKKVAELENKQKTVLGVALPEDSMKKELQTLRDEIKVLASQIHKKLKSLEPKKTDEDEKYVSINLRMQRTQHGVLSRSFVEVMAECNTIQAKYRNKNVERIQRQLKITGNDVSDEQLETMLESGQTDVFTQNILGDAKATRLALNEIETRHEEILKLERSIRDLHDMFQYLAMEVEAQGETVNRIENNIINSADYIEKAVKETGDAVISQNKARKKKVWIAVCCVVLIFIIVIALVATFTS